MIDREKWRQRLDTDIEALAHSIRVEIFDGIIIRDILSWCDTWASLNSLHRRVRINVQLAMPRIERQVKETFENYGKSLHASVESGLDTSKFLEEIQSTCGTLTVSASTTILAVIVGSIGGALISNPVGWVVSGVLLVVGYALGGERSENISTNILRGRDKAYALPLVRNKK